MSNNLAFLLADVSRLMRRRFDERARAIGVTRPQWRTLTMLNRHEGINQGGLAELLEVEPITLCRMIDRLEEAGLVERRRSAHDRRIWQIFLTDRSRPVLVELRGLADSLLEEALVGIDATTRDTLGRSVETIRRNLGADPSLPQTAHG